MLQRILATKLRDLARSFPVVSLSGPRQSGKTTLARMVFPDYHYISLEDPDTREFAQVDPRGFLARCTGPVILDEIQRTPKLLSYIQTRVDETNREGEFILTGSQQIHLLGEIGQTLAGRTAILYLLPFSLAELSVRDPHNPWAFDTTPEETGPPPLSLDTILFQGLFPRIYDKRLSAHDWLGSYYRTYVERDVRDILNIGDLSAFQRFVRLCAGRSGQLLNLSSLAADSGVTHPTAKRWLSVLEASGLIFFLQPHYKNFSKRLIKSPKLYFVDTGLLCYLLRIRKPEELTTYPLRGQIFETFIISEIYKSFSHVGEEPPLYFWRDRTGHEVDLLLDLGTRLIPVEIKSGQTIASDFFNGLNYWCSLKGNPNKTGVVVYGGEDSYQRKNFFVRAWFQCS